MYDDEKTDLLKHWDNTYKYITKARNDGSKVLVHCKMGVSRSASVVIAYAMKAYDWDFQKALRHVKEKRNCIKPNSSFISQLETYQGILDAMKNKEKLQRSKSETNLKVPLLQSKNDTTRTGNDPPPILEQLSSNVDTTSSSGQDLRQIGIRPKSWSPDISASITDPQNVFLSLENLNQRSLSKDSLKSLRQRCLEKNQAASLLLNRNVLLPCDNGESYSVSPNQIRHLPGQHYDNEHTSVKDRINELESQKVHKSINSKKKLVLNTSSKVDGECKDTTIATTTTTKPTEEHVLLDSSSKSGNVHEQIHAKLSPLTRMAVTNETWDPGEQNNTITNNILKDDVCDYKQNNISDKETECSSSATLKLRASLSKDKVPDINCAKSKTLPSKNGDPFSNQLDRVFDREERKQQRMSYPILPTNDYTQEEYLRDCPSRQNSWSSYDSAVVLGYHGETRDTPSRHSSWGSGDTRALASRNSSFGSYDMRQSDSTGYINEKNAEKTITNDIESNTSGIFPYDREEIPWYLGTVKRTRQKLEECAGKKINEQSDFTANDLLLLDTKDKSNSSDTLTSDYPSSIISQNEQNVEAFNTTLIKSQENNNVVGRTTSSAISVKQIDKVMSRLSVSAPETSTMELIPKECSLSRSVSNISTILNQTQQFSNVKKYRTVLEGLTKNGTSLKKSSSSSLEEQNSNISGIVRSRKKEFEAKTFNSSNERLITNQNQNCNEMHNNKNRANNSLPSSPISIHVDKELKESNTSNNTTDAGDDAKLRKLIGKFECGDKNCTDNQSINLRSKQNKTFYTKNNRNSYVDVTNTATYDKKNCITSATPIISSLNNKCNNTVNHDNKNVLINNDNKNIESDLKRPPVGPPVVVRNNTQTNNVVVTTKPNKKQLQYGKTHPLARLNTKPRHNNPVYNTM